MSLQRPNSELSSPPCCRIVLDEIGDLPLHSEILALVKVQGHLLANGKWNQIAPTASVG